MDEGFEMNPKETPPPIFENDPVWTQERDEKMRALWDGINHKTLSLPDAIQQTAVLIEEFRDAAAEKCAPGESATERSRMIQMMLHTFYDLHKRLSSGQEERE